MAELIFDCPACHQPVQADDAWAGQEIQCPLCQASMIVPAAQASGGATQDAGREIGKQLVPVPGKTKLSAGATQTKRSSSGSGPVFRNFQEKKVKQQHPAVKWAINGAVVVALVVAGWFAWPYARPYLPFLNKSGEEAAAPAASAGQPTEPGAATTEPAAPPPPKEVPMTAPEYTLAIASAKISEGKVNGTIVGTNFVPDLVRLEKLTTGYVLEMREGSGATPDRGLRVYLQLNPADSPTGHTWTVSQEMRGTPVSRVVRVWKTNPKYAAQEKAFTTGFALKLEFGQLTESNTLPGKIFVALPDNEKTVVGGTFNAASAQAAAPGTTAQPVAAPSALEQSPAYQQRYGPRR
jgi:hypothetical protein